MRLLLFGFGHTAIYISSEPDFLRFSVHTIIAGALSQAVFDTLLCRYELEENWRNVAHLRRDCTEEWKDRAKDEAEGVILDIEEVLVTNNVSRS